MDGTQETLSLQYFVNQKNSIIVVTFIGNINDTAGKVFKACFNEINQLKNLKIVILNLQGIVAISDEGIRSFAAFQQLIRHDFSIFLCFLHPDMSKTLDHSGVLRKEEVYPTLLSALQSIVSSKDFK